MTPVARLFAYRRADISHRFKHKEMIDDDDSRVHKIPLGKFVSLLLQEQEGFNQ
jgi:hypothetical protein